MPFTIKGCLKKISEVSADVSAVQKEIELSLKDFYAQEALLNNKEVEAKKILLSNHSKDLG